MVFERAKNALKNKEAQVRGKAWLKEVQDEGGHWKTLNDWTDQYEPPPKKKEESERKKAHKAKAKAKVTEVALNKVQDGTTRKFIQILMEVSSHLLTKVEGDLKQSSSAPKELSKLLNTASAIVLTFRFDTKKQKHHKFSYFRRRATDELTEILRQGLTKIEDGFAITKELKVLLEAQKPLVRSKIESEIDKIIFRANTKIDEKVEAVESRAAAEVDGVLGKAGVTKEEAKEKTNEALHNTVGVQLPDDSRVSDNRSVLKSKKDDAAARLGDMVKGLIVGELEGLSDQIVAAIDQVMKQLEQFLSKHKDLKPKEEEEMKETVFETVEKIYEDTVNKVSSEMQNAVNMIGGFMARDEEDDEEEDDSNTASGETKDAKSKK